MSAALTSSELRNVIRTDDLPSPLIKEQIAFIALGTTFIVCGIAAAVFGFKQEGLTTITVGVLQIAWSALSLRVRLTEDEYIHNLARMHIFTQHCLETLHCLKERSILAMPEEEQECHINVIQTFTLRQDPLKLFPKQALDEINQAFKAAAKMYEAFKSERTINNFDQLNICNSELADKLSSFLKLIEGENIQARKRLEDPARFF